VTRSVPIPFCQSAMEVEVRRGTKRSRSDARPGAAKKARTVARGRTYAPGRTFAPESKYFDTFFSASVDSAADWGSAVVANTSRINEDGSTITGYTDAALIPSGVGPGYGQVVGNKYILKKLKVRGELLSSPIPDSDDATTANTVRLMLVQDTQPNGAQVQATNLLTDWGSASQINYSFQAIASGGGGRFRVLYDKIHMLQPAMMGTDAANKNSCINMSKQFFIAKKWKKGLKIVIKSNSGTPAVANLSDNNIFLVVHSAGVSSVTIRGNSRAIYQD